MLLLKLKIKSVSTGLQSVYTVKLVQNLSPKISLQYQMFRSQIKQIVDVSWNLFTPITNISN